MKAHGAGVFLAAEVVFLEKIVLGAGDLGLLEAAQALVDPLDHEPVVVLLAAPKTGGLGADGPIKSQADEAKAGQGQGSHQGFDDDEQGSDNQDDAELHGDAKQGQQDVDEGHAHLFGDVAQQLGAISAKMKGVGALKIGVKEAPGQAHLVGEDKAKLEVIHQGQKEVFDHVDRQKAESGADDDLLGGMEAQGVEEPRQEGHVGDGGRLGDQGDKGHDEADADGLEGGADEHQREEP